MEAKLKAEAVLREEAAEKARAKFEADLRKQMEAEFSAKIAEATVKI